MEVTPTGLFSYRFDPGIFLYGAASSNGGNVLDWARKRFVVDARPADRNSEPPVFLPFLYGERAPFWSTTLGPRWLGLRREHTPGDLWSSVVEGIAFMLALYSERISASGPVSLGVLSGNGFQTGEIARILAALVPFPIRIPGDAGMATLRGAALLALESLGVATGTATDDLLEGARSIEPLSGPVDANGVYGRFDQFQKAWGQSEPLRIPGGHQT
jgi:sugar (pentulose or hexulose) kinase